LEPDSDEGGSKNSLDFPWGVGPMTTDFWNGIMCGFSGCLLFSAWIIHGHTMRLLVKIQEIEDRSFGKEVEP
jgi:hypothetical protein